MEMRFGDVLVSSDKSKLNRELVWEFLTGSYWAKGVPKSVVDTSIENSLCFGVYAGHNQVGFARVISDCSTFAYLADVFVLEGYRNRGYASNLMECIMKHPDLQGLRRWLLITRDAHGLYERYEFSTVRSPERFMEINRPDIYVHP